MILEADDLPIPLDNVIGLGREGYTFFKDGEPIELPQVHYIFYREKNEKGKEGISALCIELGLFAWGKGKQDAQENISTLCKNHTQNVLFGEYNKAVGGDMLKSFLHKLRSVKADSYWEVYRLINFRTALKGKRVVDHIKRSMMLEKDVQIQKLRYENKKLHEALGKLGNRVDLSGLDAREQTMNYPDNQVFTHDYTHVESA